MLLRLIPQIFYADVSIGLDLFIDGLGFALGHRDAHLAAVSREGCKAHLVEDAEFAAKDRPELVIETDAIDPIHADISARRPELLHPNASRVALRPWGAREFALRDGSGVCVIFREWPADGRIGFDED